MKLPILTILALSFATSAVNAADLKFSLNCGQLTNYAGTPVVGAPSYKVVKVASKDASGKWVNSYQLEETTAGTGPAVTKVYKLENAGSGDEDYTEYNVVGNSKYVQGASINFKFKWATLHDVDGYSTNRCE